MVGSVKDGSLEFFFVCLLCCSFEFVKCVFEVFFFV